MIEPTDAARILSVLVRSDDEALRYFGARTQMAEAVPIDALRWWQQHLVGLVALLERSDVSRLAALRAALEAAERGLAEAAPHGAIEEAGLTGPPGSAPPHSTTSPAEAANAARPGTARSTPASGGAPPTVRRDGSPPGGIEEPTLSSPASAPRAGGLDVPLGRPAASPWAVAAPAEHDPLDETAALDLAALADRPAATPFRAEATHAAEPPPSAVDEPDLAGETGFLDAAAIADAIAAFPLPTKLPMSVERYAALVAHSEGASEAELAALHREYDIADAAHRKRIDQELSDALSRDAALREQFADFLRQWRDWLRQTPKR